MQLQKRKNKCNSRSNCSSSFNSNSSSSHSSIPLCNTRSTCNCCSFSCSSPIPAPLRRHMVKRCPGLLVALPHFTHLSWEFMKLPPGSEANQRTTLSTARTVDAEQRTTRRGAAAAEGERGNKNAIYLLIYPRSIKYVKSTKQRGASRTARLPRCLRRRLMLAMQEQEDQELERSMVTCAASVFKLLVSRFV